MNRVRSSDLLVNDDNFLGTRAWIWIRQASRPNLKGAEHLTTITPQVASFTELKAQVDLLKDDLDEVLRKAPNISRRRASKCSSFTQSDQTTKIRAALGAAGDALRGVAPEAVRWSRMMVLPLTMMTLVPVFDGTGAGFRTPVTSWLDAFTRSVVA